MPVNYDNFLSNALARGAQWSDKNEAILTEPYTYITASPGKEIRSRMIEAFNLWLQLPEDKLIVITNIVSMLHSASLLMDDVEDDSQLRRGIPVAHKVYGVPQTINSANYIYFLAFKEIFRLRKDTESPQDLEAMVNDELLNLHRGQGLDLYWRDSLTCPTEEEYVDMVNNKTGGLFRIGVKLMMSQSKSTADYVPLVNLISIYFQIRDDYMNLQSTQYAANKGYCEDLTEGKFSFPVVHSIRADTSNRQVINVLQKRPTTPTMKSYIVGYMRNQTKTFDYTYEVMTKLERQAREEIARLGGNVKLIQIVDALHVSPPNDTEGSTS